MTDAEADPARCIPVLASLNIAETLGFYDRYLGFTGEAIGDYALLRRDAMEVHVWLAPDPIHPQNTSCYIRGGQVAALFREYRARDVPGLSPFALRPWNMLEFYIKDPHGNLLRFGCAPQEMPADVLER